MIQKYKNGETIENGKWIFQNGVFLDNTKIDGNFQEMLKKDIYSLYNIIKILNKENFIN